MGKKSKKSNKSGPKHIIVEMHNVAEFLSVVNDMLGKEGTRNLLNLKFETSLSAKIGERGIPVTVDDVIAMLQFMLPKVPERENEYYPYFINLLKAVKCMDGKDGPCYLGHGIVTSSNMDADLDVLRKAQGVSPLVKPGQLAFGQEDTSGEMSIMPIGEQGRKVTLDDIIDTFRKVSTHDRLEKFRHSGRSYFLEGFELSGDETTLTVKWGS